MTFPDVATTNRADIQELFEFYQVPDRYQHPVSGFSPQDPSRPAWAKYADDIHLFYQGTSDLRDMLTNRYPGFTYSKPNKDNEFWTVIDKLKQSTDPREQTAFFHIFQNLFGAGNYVMNFRYVDTLQEVLANTQPGWRQTQQSIKSILDTEAQTIGKRVGSNPQEATRREVLLLLGDTKVAIEDDEIPRMQRDFTEWKLDRDIPMEKVRIYLEETAQEWRKKYPLNDETWKIIKSSVHFLHEFVKLCADKSYIDSASPSHRKIWGSIYKIPQEGMNDAIALWTNEKTQQLNLRHLEKEDFIVYRKIRTNLDEIPRPQSK